MKNRVLLLSAISILASVGSVFAYITPEYRYDTVEKFVPNCYLRKEYNYFTYRWTTNEVCEPKILQAKVKVPIPTISDTIYLGHTGQVNYKFNPAPVVQVAPKVNYVPTVNTSSWYSNWTPYYLWNHTPYYHATANKNFYGYNSSYYNSGDGGGNGGGYLGGYGNGGGDGGGYGDGGGDGGGYGNGGGNGGGYWGGFGDGGGN